MNPTPGRAPNPAAEFIESSRTLLTKDYLPKLQYFLDDIAEEDIWWRPNEVSNSIGNLLLHISGNLRQWIVTPIRGTPDARDRPAEFATREGIDKRELLSDFQTAVDEVDRALADVSGASLLDAITVQGFTVTRLHAVYHAIEHCGYHFGQIAYIVKLRTGKDFDLFP